MPKAIENQLLNCFTNMQANRMYSYQMNKECEIGLKKTLIARFYTC